MPVTRQFMRERAHIAGTLHIILSPKGIHAHAFAAQVAGHHGQVGYAHDGGRALTVLGNAKTIINRCIGRCGEQPCRSPQLRCRDARSTFRHFR